MLFLLCLVCGFYYGAFHAAFYVGLCSRFFFQFFSIVITSPGEERAGLSASRAFICLFCTR